MVHRQKENDRAGRPTEPNNVKAAGCTSAVTPAAASAAHSGIPNVGYKAIAVNAELKPHKPLATSKPSKNPTALPIAAPEVADIIVLGSPIKPEAIIAAPPQKLYVKNSWEKVRGTVETISCNHGIRSGIAVNWIAVGGENCTAVVEGIAREANNRACSVTTNGIEINGKEKILLVRFLDYKLCTYLDPLSKSTTDIKEPTTARAITAGSGVTNALRAATTKMLLNPNRPKM
jgi:hypothetical protein